MVPISDLGMHQRFPLIRRKQFHSDHKGAACQPNIAREPGATTTARRARPRHRARLCRPVRPAVPLGPGRSRRRVHPAPGQQGIEPRSVGPQAEPVTRADVGRPAARMLARRAIRVMRAGLQSGKVPGRRPVRELVGAIGRAQRMVDVALAPAPAPSAPPGAQQRDSAPTCPGNAGPGRRMQPGCRSLTPASMCAQ